MIRRSLIRQPFCWTSCRLASTNQVPSSIGSNQNYFDKDRQSTEFQKAQEENAPWWLRAFATKRPRSLELYRYNPTYFTVAKFKAWKDRMWRNSEILSQSYIVERHTILGSDLATAHFIVCRGGKVKFVGSDEWYAVNPKTRTCEELPNKFVRGFYLEAVDASGTNLCYEGLVNVVNLKKLKWLRLKNCPNVDNWFLDRITGELGPSIEYLDLSGCTNLTEEMLSCMYRCKNLKELDLTGIPTTKSFQLGCLLLEEIIPGLIVTGVEYISLPSDSPQELIDDARN